MPSDTTDLNVTRLAKLRYVELVFNRSDSEEYLRRCDEAGMRDIVNKIRNISVYGRTLTPAEAALFTPLAAKVCASGSVPVHQTLSVDIAPWGRYSLLNGVCTIENSDHTIVTVIRPTPKQMEMLDQRVPAPRLAS